MFRRADWLWLIAAFTTACTIAATTYNFPTRDSAFFEYAGRALLNGQRLYDDILDLKLPAIYYVNALWQLLFDSNYRLHWLAFVGISLCSIALFARVCKNEGVRNWAAAAFAFAVFISLPGVRSYNLTEQYALLFILLAVVAAQRAAPLLCAAFIVCASLFWIPSTFLTIPVLIRLPDARVRAHFLAGLALWTLVCVSAMFAYFGAPRLHALFGYMLTYEHLRSLDVPNTAIVDRIFEGLCSTGVIVPLCSAVAGFQIPHTRAQRFAIAWLFSALAGLLLNLNFFGHYFLPAIGPLILATFMFAAGVKLSAARRVAIFMAVLLLLVSTRTMAAFFVERLSEAKDNVADDKAAGETLAASVPKNAKILVFGWMPGVYLRADRWASGKSANFFAAVYADFAGPARRMRQRRYLADAGNSAGLVVTNNAPVFPELADLIRQRFRRVCAAKGQSYAIYLKNGLRPNCAR